jgi:hypothetical protein
MTDEELQENIDAAAGLLARADRFYKDTEAVYQDLLAEQNKRQFGAPKLIANWYYS